MTEFELFKKNINDMTLDETVTFMKNMSKCEYCIYDYSCEGKDCMDGIKQFLAKEVSSPVSADIPVGFPAENFTTEFELFKKNINNATFDELATFIRTMSECDYCAYSQDYYCAYSQDYSCEGKACVNGIKKFLEKETK